MKQNFAVKIERMIFMRCGNCGKKITKKMEIEYSRDFTNVFCCPDCATTFYYEQAESRPVDYDEAVELVGEDANEPTC